MIGFLFSDSTYDSFLAKVVKSFSTSTLKTFNNNFLFPLRRKYLSQKLYPYLEDNKNILDLGSSDGRLAASIQKILQNETKKVKFIGCDIHVQPKTFIPIVSYNGKHLPFDDNSFDCVLIVDVLHHTNDYLEVLKEAKRVSRKNILVKDHYWDTAKDFITLKHADYIGNHPYGIPLPNNFLNLESWYDLFEDCQLTIIDNKTYKIFLDPCKHVVFKLEV